MLKNYIITLFIVFMGFVSSCKNDSGTNNNEEQKVEALSPAPAPASAPASAPTTPKRDSFVGGDGIEYDTEKVINSFYQDGLREGANAKSMRSWKRNDLGQGTETFFKTAWVNYYGIPSNEKAKDVYQRALKKYIKGYDEGYDF